MVDIFRLTLIALLARLAAAAVSPKWGTATPTAGASADAAAVSTPLAVAPRVGVLVQGPAVKGLFRDAECMVWALAREPVRLNGRAPAALSVFFTANYALLDDLVGTGKKCMERKYGDGSSVQFCATADALQDGDSSIFPGHMVPPGTDVRQWLRTIDVLVVFESALRSVFAMAHKLGVQRKVLVVNVDWIDGDALLALHAAVPALQVWTKGNATYTRVAQLMHENLTRGRTPNAAAIVKNSLALVPWSIPDPILRQDTRMKMLDGESPSAKSGLAPPGVVRFLFIGGMGGIRNRRGGDIALAAFALAAKLLPRFSATTSTEKVQIELDFYSVRHPSQYDMPVAAQVLQTPGLRLHVGAVSRTALATALRRTDAVLYPSRFEGLGLSLLEALHVGVPAIVTDGWPMNELIEDGHNGVLVQAQQTGWFHMAPVWEVEPRVLAQAMLTLAHDPALLTRLRCPSPGEVAARQHAFVMTARQLLLAEPPPRVISIAAPPHPHYRRAEYFRSDALRRHGYAVLDLAYDDGWAQALALGADFVLVAKASDVRWVQALKRAATAADVPVFMWFWDPIDYGQERRAWFEAVAPSFDLVFLNEKGREAMWACTVKAKVHYIEEGVMVEGDRGPGRRPTQAPAPASGADVSFQGTVYPYAPDARRVKVLLALAASPSLNLEVYGPSEMWRALNITSKGMSYGTKASEIHGSSKVALSLSRDQPGVELYRSERLMDSAGSGACVLSETFPGLDLLLPPHACLTADSTQEYLAVVSRMVSSPAACQGHRAKAIVSAWRYHTWDDSVAKFLSLAMHARPRSDRADGRAEKLGLGCQSFCRGKWKGGAAGRCKRLCGEESYNWQVGALLLGWTAPRGSSKGGPAREAVVHGTAVEAAIYFWAAMRECPENCASWQGLAVALMAQGDSRRASRCLDVLTRLRCPAPRAQGSPEAVEPLDFNFGVSGCPVRAQQKDACLSHLRISRIHAQRLQQ